MRVEDARTFRDMHELVARLIAADQLQGLRLDHIDGLLDPVQYTRRLQQLIRRIRGGDAASRSTWWSRKSSPTARPMPAFPGVAGTTGYEWLNTISRVLVDQAGRDRLDALWREIAPAQAGFRSGAARAPSFACSTPSWRASSTCWCSCSAASPPAISARAIIPPTGCARRLRLYVLEFPLYRTYVTAAGCTDNDRAIIERTIAAARRRWQGTDADIFNFLRDALTLDLIGNGLPYSRPRVRNFALKMQQFTGPMAAKSLEDTAFYRYHALLGAERGRRRPDLAGAVGRAIFTSAWRGGPSNRRMA